MAKRRGLYLIWLATTAAVYVFENNAGTRAVLLCSIALPMLSALLTVFAARRVTIVLQVPRQGTKGASCAIDVRADCPLPLVCLNARLTGFNLLTGERIEIEAPIEHQKPMRWKLRSDHCGMVTLAAEVWAQDLIGWTKRRAHASGAGAVLFEPMLFAMDASFDTIHEQDGEYSEARPGDEVGELYGLREYVPGDPVKQIHWKLSQKVGKILLREWSQPQTNDLLLVFAPSAADDADELDCMAETFLSISYTLARRECSHTAGWWDAGNSDMALNAIRTEEDFEKMRRAFLCSEHAQDAPHSNETYARFTHVVLVDRDFAAQRSGRSHGKQCGASVGE